MGRRPELINSGYYEYFKNIYSGYYEYFKNINSGYYEWLSGEREYVSSAESALHREWCMRVMHESTWVEQRVRYYVSGAWEWCTRVVHESGAWDWCTRVVHESSARE